MDKAFSKNIVSSVGEQFGVFALSEGNVNIDDKTSSFSLSEFRDVEQFGNFGRSQLLVNKFGFNNVF